MLSAESRVDNSKGLMQSRSDPLVEVVRRYAVRRPSGRDGAGQTSDGRSVRSGDGVDFRVVRSIGTAHAIGLEFTFGPFELLFQSCRGTTSPARRHHRSEMLPLQCVRDGKYRRASGRVQNGDTGSNR